MSNYLDKYFDDKEETTPVSTSTRNSSLDKYFKDEDDTIKTKPRVSIVDKYFDDFDSDNIIKADAYDSDAVGIDAWAQDSGRMTSLSNYMISRFGKEDGSKKEEETNKQYIQRFLTHARSFENNSVGLMGQIDYLRGADDNQRVEFGEVYDEYLKLPSFWQEGGDSAVRAVRDTVGQMLFDPLTLVGLGVGKVVTSTVGKVALSRIPNHWSESSLFAVPSKGAGTGAP